VFAKEYTVRIGMVSRLFSLKAGIFGDRCGGVSMIEIFVSLLRLLSLGLIGIWLLLAEYLDMRGRMELVEQHHPKLSRWLNSRPFRLVLLLIVCVMLADDVRENIKIVEAELSSMPPPMKFIAPVPPQVVQSGPRQRTFVEPRNSLRRKTSRLVKELNEFWSHRPSPAQQPVQNATTDEDRKRNAAWDQYWRDAKAAYLEAEYRQRIVGIVREYQTKGVDTGYMERGFDQPERLVGAAPFGGWQLDNCMAYMNELCQLRELSFHVNEKDERIDPNF
jgi:hypothetical protein